MFASSGLRSILPIIGTLLLAIVLAACPMPVAQWQFVQYTIYTGGDDLNGGKSIADAFITLNNGAKFGCALNAPGVPVPGDEMPPIPGIGGFSAQTFGNNSTHTVTCQLPASGANIPGSTLTVAMYQKSCGLSCDNWDLEGLAATLYTANPDTSPGTGSSACLLRAGFFGPGNNGEHPAIYRFKGGDNGTGVFQAFLPNAYTVPSCH